MVSAEQPQTIHLGQLEEEEEEEEEEGEEEGQGEGQVKPVSSWAMWMHHNAWSCESEGEEIMGRPHAGSKCGLAEKLPRERLSRSLPPPRGLLTSVTSTTLSPASGHEAWSPKGPTASSSSGHRTTTASEPHQATSSGTESALVSNSEICFVKSETTGEGGGVCAVERGAGCQEWEM